MDREGHTPLVRHQDHDIASPEGKGYVVVREYRAADKRARPEVRFLILRKEHRYKDGRLVTEEPEAVYRGDFNKDAMSVEEIDISKLYSVLVRLKEQEKAMRLRWAKEQAPDKAPLQHRMVIPQGVKPSKPVAPLKAEKAEKVEGNVLQSHEVHAVAETLTSALVQSLMPQSTPHKKRRRNRRKEKGNVPEKAVAQVETAAQVLYSAYVPMRAV